MQSLIEFDNEFNILELQITLNVGEGICLLLDIISPLRYHFYNLQVAAIGHAQLDEHEQVEQLEGSAKVRLLDYHLPDTSIEILPE